MDKTLKISSIESFIQKGSFGNGKYYGYSDYKVIGLLKIHTNKRITGIGESLVGVYSPYLFKINLNFISNLLLNKTLKESLKILTDLQKNKFFFDTGILKSVIASLEIAIFDILAQIKKKPLPNLFADFFKQKKTIKEIPVYASAGSILGNSRDLSNEIEIARNKGFEIFKARISLLNSNYKTKLKILRDEINHFSLDLISNTFSKNSNLNLINKLILELKNFNPMWIEEAFSKDDLHLFKFLKKKRIKFSYGESFNSVNDFINLLIFYKFNYINPDISHLSITDLFKLTSFMDKNNIKKKIIIHCWGGNVNLYNSLSLASVFSKNIKLVEFPITEFSLNKVFLKNSCIKNSIYYFENNIKKNQDLLKNSFFKISHQKKFTFNF